MSYRTGLGPLEQAIVKAAYELNAIPARPHVKTIHILNSVAQESSFAQSYTYEAVQHLGLLPKTPRNSVTFTSGAT